MRCVLRALLLAIALSAGGCGIVDQELNNRGGYIDHLADHWFKADSKKMRVLRAVALEVTLARISMIAPKSATDRDLLARRIGDTSKRGALVAGCAFAASPSPCFYFDSAMTDYVSALFDLAVIALPIEDAHKLLNRIAGGVIASNPVDLMSALIDLGREAIRYGRVAGAIYRDTVEMEVQVWLDTPKQDQGRRPPAFQVTEETVRPLRAIYDQGNDDLRAWKAELERLHGLGLEPVPTAQMVDALFGIVGYLCEQITSNTDAQKSCKVRPAFPGLVKTSRMKAGPSFASLAALPR